MCLGVMVKVYAPTLRDDSAKEGAPGRLEWSMGCFAGDETKPAKTKYRGLSATAAKGAASGRDDVVWMVGFMQDKMMSV